MRAAPAQIGDGWCPRGDTRIIISSIILYVKKRKDFIDCQLSSYEL
jgi:hypothetical protein